MGSFTIPLSSAIVNTVLAVVLELFILLALNVYTEFINASARRKLFKRKPVMVYNIARRYGFISSNVLIIMLCVGIELGFDGQISGKITDAPLSPVRSASLAQVSDWTVAQQLDHHPETLSLSQFQPSPARENCFSAGSSAEPTRFHLYGEDGCYNRELKSFTSLESLHITLNAQYFHLDIAKPLQDVFSQDFGLVTFADTSDQPRQVRQLSATFNVTARFCPFVKSEAVSVDASVATLQSEGLMTVSVLEHWDYTAADQKRNVDRISIVLELPVGVFFNVVQFGDLFQPTRTTTDTASLIAIDQIVSVPLFRITTYSIRPRDVQNVDKNSTLFFDDQKLTAHKVYYALSRLHFAVDTGLVESSSFNLNVAAQIDEHQSDQPNRVISLRLLVPDQNFTVVSSMSLIIFGVVMAVLLVLKIHFLLKRLKADFIVRLFDPRFVASVRVADSEVADEYSSPQYGVYMELKENLGYVLNLERKGPEVPDYLRSTIIEPDCKGAIESYSDFSTDDTDASEKDDWT